MSSRPPIFISAVSKELRGARQLVANTLTFLGYEPDWQDIFSTEEGDLRGILRRRVDACKGVVQLVGQCYGAEPPAIDEQFGRVSYTQFETLYARQRNKKIWYLFLDENFTADPYEAEPEELRELQAAYRKQVKTDMHIHHALGSRDALEANVLKLRDELTRLRRGVKQWAAAVALLLVLSVSLGIWLLQRQQAASKQIAETNQRLAAVNDKMEKLLKQGVMTYAEVETKIRKQQPNGKSVEIEDSTYTELAKQLGVDPALLRAKLPQIAEELRHTRDTTKYERANAAYVQKDYQQAEDLALASAEEADRAPPAQAVDSINQAVSALNLVVAVYNTRCGAVEANSSEEATCREQQARLNALRERITTKVNALNGR